MKFVKGVMVGSLLTTGFVVICTETGIMNKKLLIKKGRQFAKKMGLI